jgi:hypothetical protein
VHVVDAVAVVLENALGDPVYDMHQKDKRLDGVDTNGRHADTHNGLGNTHYLGLAAAM